MKFDYSATENFLSFLKGDVKLHEVLENPAYQAVVSHYRCFQGGDLGEEDVVLGLEGQPSPFYGLKNLMENLPAIKKLLSIIQREESGWLSEIEKALYRLLPNEDLSDVTIYPIIGYDAGIGHKNAACLNLNWSCYFDNPLEFLYIAIHECFHVLYEHIHSFPSFADLKELKKRIEFFNFLTHNEGYAVYAPLTAREKYGHLGDHSHQILADYIVLSDQERIENIVKKYDVFIQQLHEDQKRILEKYLDDEREEERYPYRIGCVMVNLIEEKYGMPEVQEAIYLTGSDFIKKYDHLLSSYR